jgi:REP element-mobilizing transposase RayT
MIIPSVAVFITASIHNYLPLLNENSFKEIILSTISNLCEKKLLSVYGFVIMPNHIHFIWKEHSEYKKGSESVKTAFFKFTAHQFLKNIRRKNPDHFKKFRVNKSDRKHQFWQRNPLEIDIYTDNVFEQKLDYIHHNPIQHKWQLVESAIDYKYSSIRFYENNLDKFGFLTNYFFDR